MERRVTSAEREKAALADVRHLDLGVIPQKEDAPFGAHGWLEGETVEFVSP